MDHQRRSVGIANCRPVGAAPYGRAGDEQACPQPAVAADAEVPKIAQMRPLQVAVPVIGTFELLRAM